MISLHYLIVIFQVKMKLAPLSSLFNRRIISWLGAWLWLISEKSGKRNEPLLTTPKSGLHPRRRCCVSFRIGREFCSMSFCRMSMWNPYVLSLSWPIKDSLCLREPGIGQSEMWRRIKFYPRNKWIAFMVWSLYFIAVLIL